MSTTRTRPRPQLLALGDGALLLVFGEGVDAELNRRVCTFAAQLRALDWPFVTDVVPAFNSVGLHYRAEAVPPMAGLSPFQRMQTLVGELLDAPGSGPEAGRARTIDIPVCYGGEHGPDLEALAKRSGLSNKDLIARHTALAAQVFMLGFAPGLPYLGLWDDSFDVPRRDTPRTRVPAGSVAVANRQSVIYPFELPGGWHLIGRTPLSMFEAQRLDRPALLGPGDRVRFVAISAREFEKMTESRPA